jgi:MFS family permease
LSTTQEGRGSAAGAAPAPSAAVTPPSAPAGPPGRSPIRELFADPSYRAYFLSAVAFTLGIWAYLTAMGWSALELTDSAFMVSLVNVIYFVPMFVLALPAGVLADSVDLRRLVLWVRGGSAALITALVVLAATGALTFPWLAGLSAGVGLSVVLELAARQSLVAQIVPPARLVGATALSSVQGGLARVVGPLLAGWLITRTGAAGGYAIFVACNVAFVLWFRRIRVAPVPRDADRRPWVDFRAGLSYLRGHRDALAIVVLSILGGVVGWLYLALLPVMARDVLDGDAVTLGWLSTAVGLGSVPGAIVLAARARLQREGLVHVAAMLTWGLGVVGFGLAPGFPAALGFLGLAGVGFGMQTILTQSLLLRIVEPAYHGRVLGTLMLTWGANIVGTLAGGSLAEVLGPRLVVAGSGGLIVLFTLAVVAWNRRLLRL